MTIVAHVGTITQKTTTGNQGYTGVGFTPKVVFFFGVGLTAAGNGVHARIGLGIGVSSSSRAAICADDVDAAATTDTDRRHDNTKCLTFNEAGTLVGAADLVTLDGDGFTLNWTTTDGTQRLINYLALGGSELSVFLKQIQAPGSAAGNIGYTGVGFQPDALIAISTWNQNAPAVTNNDAGMAAGIGIGSANDEAFSTSYAADNASAVENLNSGYLAGSFLLGHSGAGGANTRGHAELVSLDADGFTLNWLDSDQTDYIWVLCLAGGAYAIGEITEPASPGTQGITTGIAPAAVLFLSGQKINNTTDNTTTDNYGFCIGAASSSSARATTWVGSDDAADPTATDRASLSDKVITLWTPGTPTKVGEADLTAMSSTGFTLDWGTANGTQYLTSYLAIGNSVITISPTPVTVPIVVTAPTITRDQVISPSPVAIPISIPAPTISLQSTSIIKTWKSAWEEAWV